MYALVVLTRDKVIADAARSAAEASKRPVAVAASLGELSAMLREIEWTDLVIDRDHEDATAAAARIGKTNEGQRLICVVRDANALGIDRAHAVVLDRVLGRALVEIAAARAVRLPAVLERVLGTTTLGSTLDEALDAAAHELAVAFGVSRCVISEHGEQTGSGINTDGATIDAQAWTTNSQLCRRAATLGASVVVPALSEVGACDTYAAAPLATPRGSVGFVALLATGARVFTADELTLLRAIAVRIGHELRWRTIHDRTSEDLERVLSGPGIDAQLGVWNRAALDQIVHGHASHAHRSKLPLSVLAIRVVDLERINARHGVAIGDRVLLRIADALKPALRSEDLVGRYSGTVMIVGLPSTGSDDGKVVAERIHGLLRDRVLETPDGSSLPILTTIGVAGLVDSETGTQLLTRAARATKQAPDNVITMLSGQSTFTGRIPRASDSPDIQMRATLGGSYRLRHEISRGGMGVVYRADDLALERPVAIKMMRPELSQNQELVQHLRREAAMLARVHHPNLVQIYNFGSSDGDCYFVMELVEGESMQQAIERHAAERRYMTLPELVSVVEQIASALDALHERGIVHRDVKPANFIRDPFSGRSVLVDVGIAHRFGELSKQAGTPGFMAPEVIQGLEPSARSDVYGLAGSVFAMATLTPPYGEGEPVEIIMRQCNEAPPKVSSLRGELAPLDELLENALNFDVDRRPKSASEFARAMARALGVRARPSTREHQGAANVELEAAGSPKTRGVVLRTIPRVLGISQTDRLRDAIGVSHPELAHALLQAAPLAWEPTRHLLDVFDLAHEHLGREPELFARQIARAAVRASFKSFFPASLATLHPDRTLSAIRGIWSRYHTWGVIAAVPVGPGETIIRLTDTLRVRTMCDWTAEMLNTLVMLSSGTGSTCTHDGCEIDGGDACMFRLKWDVG